MTKSWDILDADEVTTPEELEGAVKALGLDGDARVFVDYAAPWCGKCKKFKGKLKEMNLAVLEVDVSECEDLALEKGVSAVPYFEVFGGDGKLMIGTGDFDAAVALLPEDVKMSAVPKEEAVAPKAMRRSPF